MPIKPIHRSISAVMDNQLVNIEKNRIGHGRFSEHVWSNRSFSDAAERKKLLAQTVWNDCGFADGFYLNILFFREYFSGFCNLRLARYKKVYRGDVPSVISEAELKSEEQEIPTDDSEIVYAANVISPCTCQNFQLAYMLLHESYNRHLATVSRSNIFIPEQSWHGIFVNTAKIGYCLDDHSVVEILSTLPADSQMLWTGGFFDDADICCSIIAR